MTMHLAIRSWIVISYSLLYYRLKLFIVIIRLKVATHVTQVYLLYRDVYCDYMVTLDIAIIIYYLLLQVIHVANFLLLVYSNHKFLN